MALMIGVPDTGLWILATLVSFVLGYVWYSDMLFGKQWRKAAKPKKPYVDKLTVTAMSLFSTAVIAWALYFIVFSVGASNFIEGAVVAFYVWLAFFATTSLSRVLWEGTSFRVFLINSAYNLLSLVLMGAILATGM
ncbi:MAG: DUF1761 domain-containing protein [Methanobacteriota archaeon]|nr:MAG: DUF1761 domain-containing protein [Euryarchaeota archaeon]